MSEQIFDYRNLSKGDIVLMKTQCGNKFKLVVYNKLEIPDGSIIYAESQEHTDVVIEQDFHYDREGYNYVICKNPKGILTDKQVFENVELLPHPDYVV